MVWAPVPAKTPEAEKVTPLLLLVFTEYKPGVVTFTPSVMVLDAVNAVPAAKVPLTVGAVQV